MDEKKKKGTLNFLFGIFVGIILYKVIFDVLWPMIF